MLEETASVVSISDGRAVVAMVRSEACGSCSAKSMCHPSSGEAMQMEVSNPAGAKPGDRVTVSLPPAELLKASAMAYMMPAMAIVGGAAIGWSKSGTDKGAMIGAGAGFILSTAYLFIQGRKGKHNPAPFISKIQQSGGLGK